MRGYNTDPTVYQVINAVKVHRVQESACPIIKTIRWQQGLGLPIHCPSGPRNRRLKSRRAPSQALERRIVGGAVMLIVLPSQDEGK